MNVNEKQIALSVLESLREDLIYAHLNDGCRIRDVADLRQYIYEMMNRIRTTAFLMSDLYDVDNGHGQDNRENNGHNGKAHRQEKSGESVRSEPLDPKTYSADQPNQIERCGG